MTVAGIDLSSRAVDVVVLDEDTDAATWHRVTLHGNDAFDRAREVRCAMLELGSDFWDAVIACGIEDPRGYGAGSIYRVQGAILACLPRPLLVQPWVPSSWRKTVGLPGNASKQAVDEFALRRMAAVSGMVKFSWPQDACDAYCIALATRMSVQVTA